ncbi:MAG TPA: hypothetical protein VD866_24445, partial [Urbifossiella sp.]|nr:hypothetical protein [Urbifossiella sp.]
LDAELTAIAGLSSAADAAPYFTGVGAAALMTVTAAARTVLDDATVGAMLATLGGQPLDADLTVLAGITIAANTFPARSSSGAAAAKAITDFGLSLVDDADATAARTTLGLGTVAVLASDTDALLGANSDLRVATQRAVKSYVDASVVGLLDLKGSVSCSGNPDYAAASKGDAYYVSSAGKIGGASGKSVDVGDVVVASADNAGGTEAAVGTSWFVLEHNLTGALVAANNLSDLASATTARGNLGLGTLATQSGTFSGTSSGTNTGDQTITLTGNVTGSGTGSFATTIAAGAVTLARMADVATATVFYRKTAGTGAPEVQTLATLKTDLGLTGTNSGDQTITLTGDVTGSGTGSFAATIASDAVTFAKMQNSAAAGLSVVGRSTNSAGDFAEINAASDGQVLRRSGTAVGFGAVDLASANAVTGVLPAANLTAASDTVAGAIEIATAAEIETGTDTVRAVTPGRQHNHKSAAKAWVVFTVSGTTVTIRDSYGLAAVNPVVRNGVGDYTLNFATAFSSAYYFVACGVCVNTAGTATLWGLPNNLAPPTASACRVIYVTSGGAANEAARVDVACFGDQ